MTLLDLYRKVKGICGCLNSADVPLKCNGNDFNVDSEIKSKDAVVSHIEVKHDDALTWEDVKNLDHLLNDVDFENGRAEFLGKDIPFDGDEGFYGEVLKRFNEQRKK